MERQLRQMLDHLRLEAGAVQPHITDLAVGPLIARVAALAEVGADRAAIDIRLQPSRMRVRADPDLTERALSNLVDNARKHARCSRILLGARRVGARVRIWVIDDGVGIAEADLPHLFDDYVQGSNHDDEIRGGFGLGLASVQRMMALMSGTAGLDPRWRRGSAFYLDFAAVDESATDATITGAAKE